MVVKKPEPQKDEWVDEPKEQVVPVIVQGGDGKITVTLKAGAGFEVPWIVRHANTVAEALEFMQDEQLDELMDLTARKAKEFAKAFGGSAAAAKPVSSGGSWGAKKPVAKPAVNPSEDVYECDHGERNWVAKRGAKGMWYAYMCSAPQGARKCDVLWANEDGTLQDR